MLVSQLVGKIVEPLRNEALMEEVGHWRWALQLYRQGSLPVPFQFPE